MQRRWLLGLILALALAPSASLAETCTAADCTWTVSGTEPNQRTNGAALDDLKQINIKMTVNGAAQPIVIVPATAPTGGGTFTSSVTLASPACKSTTLVFTASASSLGGLESGDAVPVTKTKDRTGEAGCAPKSPSFTVN